MSENKTKKVYITCGELAVVMQGDDPVEMCRFAVSRFGTAKELNTDFFLLSERGFRYHVEDMKDDDFKVPFNTVVMGDNDEGEDNDHGVPVML